MRYLLLMIAIVAGSLPSIASARHPLGWHRVHRYGTCDSSHQDVWDDLCRDVYGEGKLDDLYADPHGLFDLDQGSWNCSGCRYAPLHYHSVRHQVFTSATPYAGASWYRGMPVGARIQKPLSTNAAPHDHSERVP